MLLTRRPSFSAFWRSEIGWFSGQLPQVHGEAAVVEVFSHLVDGEVAEIAPLLRRIVEDEVSQERGQMRFKPRGRGMNRSPRSALEFNDERIPKTQPGRVVR